MADPRAVTEALARRGLARGPIISPQTNVNISTPRQLPNSLAGVELSDARDRLLSAMAPVEQKYGSGWGAALAGALKGVGKYMERQGAEKNWELAKDEYLQEERSRAQESARAEEQKRVQELADKIRLEQEKAKLRVQYPSSPTTTVNVGDSGPQMGTIPQGWQVVKDGDAYRMEPVPGGPASRDLDDDNKDKSKKTDLNIASARQGVQIIDNLLSGKPGPGWSSLFPPAGIYDVVTGGRTPLEQATGIESILPSLPGGPAADAEASLEQLRGKVFMQAIDGLKGTGTITEIEGAKGEAAIAALQSSQSDRKIKESLLELRSIFKAAMARERGEAPPIANAGSLKSPPAPGASVEELIRYYGEQSRN